MTVKIINRAGSTPISIEAEKISITENGFEILCLDGSQGFFPADRWDIDSIGGKEWYTFK